MYQELDYQNKPIHLVIQQYSKTFVDQVLLHEVSLKSSKNTLTLSVGLDKIKVPKDCHDAVVALVHQVHLYQKTSKLLMSLSPSQAINDDIEFYVAISAYLINVLAALREEIKNDAPRARDKWWSSRLDYHFTMAFNENSLTEKQQANALESLELSWNDFSEKKERCLPVKHLNSATIHDAFCKNGSNMCGGSTAHLFSIEEMIAQAAAEHTTDHAAESEITETQQVAITQLEGAIHMDEMNAGEYEHGDIIGMDSNTKLAFATESEENHDIDMINDQHASSGQGSNNFDNAMSVALQVTPQRDTVTDNVLSPGICDSDCSKRWTKVNDQDEWLHISQTGTSRVFLKLATWMHHRSRQLASIPMDKDVVGSVVSDTFGVYGDNNFYEALGIKCLLSSLMNMDTDPGDLAHVFHAIGKSCHQRDVGNTNPRTSSPYQPTVPLRMILNEDIDRFMTSDHDGRMDAEGEYNASQGEVTHIRNTVENSLECDSVDVGHSDAMIKRKRTLCDSQPPSKDDDRGTEKRPKLDIHLMPVQDIPHNITSASPPAANIVSLALGDHCALSKSIPVDSTAFSDSMIHEYPVDNERSASSGPSNTGSVVTDPVEDMDMMTGVTPAYVTSSEVTGNSSNREHEDANGSENDRETGGAIVEVTAADTHGIVGNNGTSDSSALSVSTAVAKTMFVTPSWIDSPWADLSGEHVPSAIPVWINALKMVDRSPSRIRVPPGVGTGFRWPDPALFTHIESNTQLARYLLHYLSCRSWFGVVNRRALFRSIYWKEFLEGLSAEKQLKRSPPNSRIYSILNRGDGIDEGEARVIREQALDAFNADAQEARDVFNWVDVQFNGRLAMTFEFRGLAFQLKDLLKFPPPFISHIIWELCENNFADDVLWLDALFRRGHNSTDTYGPERSVEVYGLCGKQESNTPIPLVRSSFGSQRWRRRVTHVEAFRQLMSTWPEFPDHLKTPVPTENEYLFQETEVNVIAFYAQTHFDYIGRLPVMPRQVPDIGPLWLYNVFRKNL